MKVLVIGSGGREHVIAWKLAQSPQVSKLYCCPGNGGTAIIAENIAVNPNDLKAIADFAEAEKIDLTVVGPDAYLAEGTVDIFQARGLKVFGPTRNAAQLEWSKSFSKDFMKRYGIPTAQFETFIDPIAAKSYIKKMGAPIVIKADGLAAGKGVIVAMDLDTAFRAVDQIMTDRAFGESGSTIVVEEFLEGEEVSLLAFCDGKIAVPMLPAQDHKRIGDGDTGPNTGGMGNYAPTTIYSKEIAAQVVQEILNPTIGGMLFDDNPFVGILFVGLMITPDGPKVIEFNARFGDPEAQVVLPLLESDLAQIFLDAIAGQLDPEKIIWKKGKTAVCVVAASGGYPGAYPTGKVIQGLEQVNESLIFHAGTKLATNGDILTAGGRVLNVVYLGDTIQEAIAGAYRDLRKISFEGMYYRKDIAKRELDRFQR